MLKSIKPIGKGINLTNAKLRKKILGWEIFTNFGN